MSSREPSSAHDEMSAVLTDAERVAAIRGGDPAAWGDVFDRYRDAVYRVAWSVTRNPADAEDVVSSTFLRGVESIDQLREPGRLRSWLLAIARRESLDRVRRGRVREVTVDPSAGLEELIGDDSEEPGTDLQRTETVRLVQAALDGLDARDRATLELSERQELTGDELAETLGVTRDNAYAMVHNAKARFELSVSSLVVARDGREDCPDLGRILHGWDGRLSPLVRKRVGRHVKGCDTCESTRRLRVSPAALLGLLPVVVIPTLIADRSKAAAMEAAETSTAKLATKSARVAAGGFSGKAAIIAAVALAAVVGGTAFLAAGSVGPAREEETDGRDLAAASDAVAGELGPATDDEPSGSAPTESLAATTTQPVAATTGPCEAARALFDFASPGPASASEADVRTYLTTTNDLVHAVVAAYSPIATDEMVAYAASYQLIVDAGIQELSKIPDAPELATLATAVERQLAADCNLDD